MIKLRDKAAKRCSFAFAYFPDWYKTQEMCASVVSQGLFMLVYCRNRYKTQKMCDEAVDGRLAALKFIPDWFVTSEILEKFHNALLSNNGIHLLLIEDIFLL